MPMIMPYDYPANHQADIHFIYGFCNGNAAAAVREYRRRFPGRHVPNLRTFTSIHRRFSETGIRPHRAERVIDLSVAQENNIMNLIIEDPTLSTRRIGIIVGVSHMKVWHLWKRYGLHPYHYRKAQGILAPDHFSRVTFCQRLNDELIRNPMLLQKILWMDEAQFTRAGVFNSKNLVQWLEINPNAHWEASHQTEFSVNMWAGVFNNQLIGPIEIPHRLNADNYLEFLRNIINLDFFEDVDLETLGTMWLQHDGAPAHYGAQVRQYLNSTFPGRWIGRGSTTIAWPARSPDLTPLDFYVWGTLKDKVYSAQIQSREQLLARIDIAAEEMRRTVVNLNGQIRTRLGICIEKGGGHFENYLH